MICLLTVVLRSSLLSDQEQTLEPGCLGLCPDAISYSCVTLGKLPNPSASSIK